MDPLTAQFMDSYHNGPRGPLVPVPPTVPVTPRPLPVSIGERHFEALRLWYRTDPTIVDYRIMMDVGLLVEMLKTYDAAVAACG